MGDQSKTCASFTLRFSLGSAFVGVVVLASLLLGLSTFFSVREFVRQGVRERLGDTPPVLDLRAADGIHFTAAGLRKISTALLAHIAAATPSP